jgi:hypothetical protein
MDRLRQLWEFTVLDLAPWLWEHPIRILIGLACLIIAAALTSYGYGFYKQEGKTAGVVAMTIGVAMFGLLVYAIWATIAALATAS